MAGDPPEYNCPRCGWAGDDPNEWGRYPRCPECLLLPLNVNIPIEQR